ncbi:MAG: PHB depolymerase family esterase [Saprospiraceae bacterium]|nr:PHB depolymerase family esterase [Saprospiraceae bacterium]
MKNLQGCLLAMLLLWTVACKDEPIKPDEPTFTVGKNRFTTQIDGDEREYFVHVPAGYTGNSATPIVFMLHGTSGNGEEFYNKSGWREVGESNNILTVFPSSWRHCIKDEDGTIKNTTKWNSQPAEWTYCANETPRDDIKFLKTIISEMNAKFNIDSKRIYLVGFSNGGQMAAKCTIVMSDQFAAIVESASSLFYDSTYTPLRKMPILFQVGNEDYGPGNTGPAIPLSLLDTLISTPDLPLRNGKYYRIAHTHTVSFGLDPNFTIGGDTTSVAYAVYKPLITNPLNSFRFVMIKGLAHAYPNGDNHPLEAAVLNWEWLKQFSLP